MKDIDICLEPSTHLEHANHWNQYSHSSKMIAHPQLQLCPAETQHSSHLIAHLEALIPNKGWGPTSSGSWWWCTLLLLSPEPMSLSTFFTAWPFRVGKLICVITIIFAQSMQHDHSCTNLLLTRNLQHQSATLRKLKSINLEPYCNKAFQSRATYPWRYCWSPLSDQKRCARNVGMIEHVAAVTASLRNWSESRRMCWCLRWWCICCTWGGYVPNHACMRPPLGWSVVNYL